MKRCGGGHLVKVLVMVAAISAWNAVAEADPSKYPEFAQQKPANDVTPVFISVDQLVKEITDKRKPSIVDVRTAEEYREAHILGAISAPLSEFNAHVQEIPRDRPVILY